MADPKQPAKTVLGWQAQPQPQPQQPQWPPQQPQPPAAYAPTQFQMPQPQSYQPQPQSYQPQPQSYPQYGQPSYPSAAQPQGYQHQPYPVDPGYGHYHGYGPAPAPMPAPAPAAGYGHGHAVATGHRPIEHANATVGVSDRVRFIRLTYLHLLGAILAFAGLEYLLMTNATLTELVSAPFVKFALGGRWNWGVVLAAFMVVSYAADYWASHATSRATQYLGLGIYVIAEAVIFVPLLAIVEWKTASIIAKGGGDPHIVRDSAFVTLAIFGALTASVFISRKDFSWLRSGLAMASAAALMLIFLSLGFGFNLGIVFSVAMVLLAAGYILFQTSQIIAHHDPREHVSAALALFSSVALMFWYVIRIFLRARE